MADARFYCLAVAAAAVWLALRLSSPQRSVSGWQLLLNPLVLLMAAGSGTDIGVIGLNHLGARLVRVWEHEDPAAAAAVVAAQVAAAN